MTRPGSTQSGAATLTEQQQQFLKEARSAVMVTLRADGSPHAVRVGVALVDGKLWSSGVPSRVRTRNIRRDPRGAITSISSQFGYLTLEGTFSILEGPPAAEQSVRLFRAMQQRDSGPLLWNGQPLEEDAFLQAMRDEQRLIYQLEPTRIYGLI